MVRFGLRPVIGVIVALAASLAACGEQAATLPPESPPDAYLLRASLTQALPPENVFAWTPAVTITGDLVVVTSGEVPAIFPGPLVPNLRGREISRAGYDRIVSQARTLGLLDGDGDFSPPDVAVGMQLGRIEISVDGGSHILTGDPSRVIQCIRAPCDPPPATPEAFATFWQQLSDLPANVGDELGPEFGYRPDGFALLIGVEHADGGAGIEPRVRQWPLATPLADLGRPIGDRLLPRCATVEGDDAATLATEFEASDQLTRWVDPGGAAADALSIAVRPLVPGEDVCGELFGITE